MAESDDESDDEWLNRAISRAKARTGKDVLVEACEKSEAEEESEESDDGSDEESSEEGPHEDFGEEAELTRRDLDKSLWPAEKEVQTDEHEPKRSELNDGAEDKRLDGDQRTSSKCPPSAICPRSPEMHKQHQSKKRKHGIIYMIRHRSSGMSYCGLTTQKFLKRMQQHEAAALKPEYHRKNSYLHNFIRKYGWDAFDKFVLYSNVPKAFLGKMERLCIALYKTRRPHGFNLTDGGEESAFGDPEVAAKARKKSEPARLIAYASNEFKQKISSISTAVWSNLDPSDQQTRSQKIANSRHPEFVRRREARIAELPPERGKYYWERQKRTAIGRIRRRIAKFPSRFVGKDPIADAEKWWGPSFEERRRE